MKQFKPILIPTEDKHSGIDMNPQNDNKLSIERSCYHHKNPHVIIIVDTEAEIVEGNKYYTTEVKTVFDAYCDSLVESSNNSSNCFKIISSTNKSHVVDVNLHKDFAKPSYQPIPQLSPQSIQLLINYYNEHKCMPESVEVKRHFKQSKVIFDCFESSTTVESLTNKQGEVDITIPEVKEKKMIFPKHTKQEGDYLRVYGAGKFQEESLVLDKDQAALLLIDLFKFINIKPETKVEEKLYTEGEVYGLLLQLQTSFPIHRLVQITPLELKEWFNSKKK